MTAENAEEGLRRRGRRAASMRPRPMTAENVLEEESEDTGELLQ